MRKHAGPVTVYWPSAVGVYVIYYLSLTVELSCILTHWPLGVRIYCNDFSGPRGGLTCQTHPPIVHCCCHSLTHSSCGSDNELFLFKDSWWNRVGISVNDATRGKSVLSIRGWCEEKSGYSQFISDVYTSTRGAGWGGISIVREGMKWHK